MTKPDSTNPDCVESENPVTRLVDTVTKIIDFVKANRHEPKFIWRVGLEFNFSENQEDLRSKLAKEFRRRLQVCKVRFLQVGIAPETINDWSDWLQDPTEAILYFDKSIRQMKVYSKKSSTGEWKHPEHLVENFLSRKIGEVTSALQRFDDMEDVFRPVPAKIQGGESADNDAANVRPAPKAESTQAVPDTENEAGISPALAAVRGVYEWALSEIPDADGMTIQELFDAIQHHPKMTSEYLEQLPRNEHDL